MENFYIENNFTFWCMKMISFFYDSAIPISAPGVLSTCYTHATYYIQWYKIWYIWYIFPDASQILLSYLLSYKKKYSGKNRKKESIHPGHHFNQRFRNMKLFLMKWKKIVVSFE